MPRQIIEELTGYEIGVGRIQVPETDARGQVVHAGDGLPKLIDVTRIVFVDEATNHQVIVPLTEEGRKFLLEKLAGGIVIANGDLR